MLPSLLTSPRTCLGAASRGTGSAPRPQVGTGCAGVRTNGLISCLPDQASSSRGWPSESLIGYRFRANGRRLARSGPRPSRSCRLVERAAGRWQRRAKQLDGALHVRSWLAIAPSACSEAGRAGRCPGRPRRLGPEQVHVVDQVGEVCALRDRAVEVVEPAVDRPEAAEQLARGPCPPFRPWPPPTISSRR